MRDLVLASKYAQNGNTIIFATQNLDGNINHKISDSNFQVHIINSNNVSDIIELINIYKIDLIIIDHYSIDYNYEKTLKKKTNVSILSFDDTYEKHYCDILLNHNIYADSNRYKELVPSHCDIKCGEKYTLLREEFIKEKKTKTILLTMGGADSTNLNISILDVLQKFDTIKVIIVTTSANKNIKILKNYCDKKSWIKLYINSKKIAKIMKQSDYAITTPSVTSNELYFMNIPFIAIKIAQNQKEMYNYLKNKNYNVLSKFKPKRLTKILNNLLGDQNDKYN